MRKKIDELIVINLIWFVVASFGTLLHIQLLMFLAIICALGNLVYDIMLLQKIHKTIDDKYQPHLRRRVNYNGLFTLVFIIFTAINIFF